MAGRHLEGHAGPGDRLLGADDALGDRRLGHDVGPGDLGHGEPADEAQRQGDPGRTASTGWQATKISRRRSSSISSSSAVVDAGVVVRPHRTPARGDAPSSAYLAARHAVPAEPVDGLALARPA